MNTLNVVESIFFAAMEKATPAARSAYLDEACNGDAKLRRCVERLLNAHPKADNVVPERAPGLAATVEAPSIEERPGTVIGPYKLLQQLGEGGFGVVFMAEQEQPVRRKVALKIIKPGMDSKQVIARFEAERQALALMDHPNIARVLDGGTTESNRPYFVMELVKGVPITEFCDKNRLTPRERLELFVQVCNAVQHAHQKGVIHRDIKPSNVLVTMYDDRPVPKVIDFGVAKAIEQKLTEQTMFTRVGQVIGTLEYMSPEQASLNALDVDTRSDVYALGVLLYELLTGTTPLDKDRLQGVAFLEMLRLIREEEPLKPSTRLTQSGDGLSYIAAYRKSDSQKLPREVRGELDWITMKALEKDRARRYNAASALAADVQRFLKDEHVEACPPTFAYRLQKYARKHKALMATMSAVAAILLIGIAATSWQAIRATDAETAALGHLKDKETALLAEAKLRKVADDLTTKAIGESQAHKLAREELRRSHYAVAMSLIPAAYQADNLKRVHELLEEQRPKPGDADDLRGFEWDYWDRLAHAEKRSLRLAVGASTPAISGDGMRLAYIHATGEDSKGGNSVKIIDTTSGQEVAAESEKGKGALYYAACALNHDGRRLACFYRTGLPSRKEEIAVWDVATGKCIFAQKVLGTQNLLLSPDGKRLLTWNSRTRERGASPEDERAAPEFKVWDVDSPDRAPVVLDQQTKENVAFAFSPDGSRIAGVFFRWGPRQSPGPVRRAAQIFIWDAATGKKRAEATSETLVCGIAFSPNGRQLTGVGGRGSGTFGPPLLKGPNNEVKAVGITYQTYLWDGADGDELKLVRSTPLERLNGLISLPMFEPSADGSRLAVWSPSKYVVRIVDTATGEPLQVLKSAHGTFHAKFLAGATRLLTVERDRATATILKEWAIAANRPQATDPMSRTPIESDNVVWSGDGKRQAMFRSTPGASLSIRDADGNQISECNDYAGSIAAVMFSPNSKFICAWGTSGHPVRIFETETGKTRWSPQPSVGFGAKKVNPIGFLGSPEQFTARRFLVLEDEKEKIKIINFDDLEECAAFTDVSRFIVSPDGKRLVVHYKKKDVPGTLWDVEAKREIVSLPRIPKLAGGTDSLVATFFFSEDSRWLATMSFNNVVTVWDAVTGQKRTEIDSWRFAGSDVKLTFSGDGKRLAMFGARNVGPIPLPPSIHDIDTGKVVCRLEGHAYGVVRLAFSPDGKRIATFARNIPFINKADINEPAGSEIKLWEAATGRELLSLPTASPGIGGRLSFSSDGRRLLLSAGSPSQQTWDATPRDGK